MRGGPLSTGSATGQSPSSSEGRSASDERAAGKAAIIFIGRGFSHVSPLTLQSVRSVETVTSQGDADECAG